MGTSRTGTARWKHLRRQALRDAQHRGQTHCLLCPALLDYEVGRIPNSAEADHILPHSRGGQDTLDNIRIICRHCNQSRGARTARPIIAATTTTLVHW